MIPCLPYATEGFPGTGGAIRASPSHFMVEEIPLYEPSGSGNHLYINITKESLTTKDACSMIARTLGINESDIGFAGLKDRNAITTQTISIPISASELNETDKMIEKLKPLPFRINWAKLHGNKLRTGHLLGNRFSIIISGIDDLHSSIESAEKTAEAIKNSGIPNYFGSQRFGAEGDNSEKGRKIISGELRIRDRWLRRFLISSFQSEMCNFYLAERLRKGLFNKILEGDIAKKYDTGGLFEVKDVATDQTRYENKEISFTAPIYGTEMWKACGESGMLEEEVFSSFGIGWEAMEKSGISGTRRLGRLLVPDLRIEKCQEGLLLNFTLPKGAFATTVLREMMKTDCYIQNE